ncbi:MAG TPA: M10 family metallopeptidase C-terminal domain-containing protein, partial [Allosphingosinicella sp.]
DTVQSSVTYTLSGWELENLTLTGFAAINGTGNHLANVITGNTGANTLSGGAGADVLLGGDGIDALFGDGDNDILYGGEGADRLTGGAGDDTLLGEAGDDILYADSGNDALYGGIGNDTYVVSAPGAFIVEYAGEGADTVESSVSYVLSGWYIEGLTLTGTAAINGTGNQIDNVITGNNAANTLHGGSGADTLTGLGGDDTLVAQGGDDALYGGTGNDTYVVDTAGTFIVEQAGEGTDTVESSVSYTLSGWEIENLTLTGSLALDGTGNHLGNRITGNNAANVLNGAAGDDTLIGGGGADTLIGGDGHDDIQGGAGDDILQGDAGQDLLTGGAGSDVYRFTAVGHSAFGAADMISGFETGIDRIDLSLIDANSGTAAHDSFLFIGSVGFTNRAGELRVVQNGSTLDLYADLNGDSVADMHVRVVGNGLVVGDITGAVASPPNNQAPAISSGTVASLAENSATSTIVYQTVASDPDGDPVTYRLSGADAALFSIDASGAVRLLSPADFEARNSYAFTVHAEDGRGGSTAQPVTLSIQNVNEAPVITSGTTATIAENSPTSTIVYQVVANDPDGNALTYTLGGADAALFTIDQNGAVRFIQSPDFEARSSYSFSVQASDGSLSATRGVNVTVTDVNENSGSTPTINEISTANDTIPNAQAILRSQLAVAPNPNLPDQSLPSIQINGSINPLGDRDFFSITLEAGELLILDVDGTTSLDSVLRVYGPNGLLVAENDDPGGPHDPGSSAHSGISHNLDSLIRFRATTSGTYTFSIESYTDTSGPSSSGSYVINLSVGPPAPQSVIDQENIDALISGSRWNSSTVTYGFTTDPSQYPGTEGSPEKTDNFEPLNATQRAVTATTFAMITSYTGLAFSENVASPGLAQIRLAQSDDPDTAHAYYPGLGDGGDAWFRNHATDSNTGDSRFENPQPGNYAYLTFLHELGHAMGLKHGHESPALSPDRDSMEFSIMTYRGYIGANYEDGGYRNETWGFAQSFMMYDIAALQKIYGANFNAQSGDTTYTWNSTTGAFSINGVTQWTPGGNRVFQTIWDGGGTDTYNLSNYTNAVTIDLRPGEWTTTSQAQLANLGGNGNPLYARGNVANALLFNGDTRSLIENAVGGGGNDTIIANQASNRLTGGNGVDTFAWRSIGDAQTTNPDRILDFVQGSDKIDLSAIDAISGTPANDAFSFIGTNAFTGTAGQVRYAVDANGVNVYADVDGNGLADLHIIVNGTSIAA